jgi:hydrogenase maturation protease
MISDEIERVVNAVLYEGYILYPYRASIKNRQRWTFGGLYPEPYCRVQNSADLSSNQTECLLRAGRDAMLEVTVRFLHLMERTVGAVTSRSADVKIDFRPVESLEIGGRTYRSWQEAEVREVKLPALSLKKLLISSEVHTFSWPDRQWLEPLRGLVGDIEGALARAQRAVAGAVTVGAVECDEGLFKISVRVANHTPLEPSSVSGRDQALLRTLVSSHTVLQVTGGEFVSLTDPPEDCVRWAAECKNIGVWPVLVGAAGSHSAMLASPIILPDHPQIAAESPGDLFDGTEIDEILTLRILTLTEEEKRAAAALDERSRGLLMRTEALAREQLQGLHGVLRTPRPSGGLAR